MTHSEELGTEREMVSTRAELINQVVPIHLRDYCSHRLIPLNRCRRDNFYLPWTCHHQKHKYEVCLYEEYERRRRIKQTLKEEGTYQP